MKKLILASLFSLIFFTGCANSPTPTDGTASSGDSKETELSETQSKKIAKKRLIKKKKKRLKRPRVVMETNRGTIELELYPKKAPITVANFLAYVDQGFYNGTIFHRIIDGFMIQGGGFTREVQEKRTMAPIKNEANNGLSNDTGTIAMARTNVVDSATSQFYINVNDNISLNHSDPSPRGYGYAVFGRVVKGMPTVNRIKRLPTHRMNRFANMPRDQVVILSVKRK